MRKWVTLLIIGAVLAAGGFAFYRWREQQKTAQVKNFQTEIAGSGDLVATIGATGQVRSNQSADLIWKTSGTVQDVLVKVGDRVESGEKLAELSVTSLPQAVILAQADLASAQRTLEDLYTNAETAKVQALQSIANSAQAVKNAQYQLDNFSVPENQAKLGTIEAVDYMEHKLDEARAAFEPLKFYPSTDPKREDLKEILDQAQSDYNVAVKRLDYEYALQVAQANLAKARKDYEKWEDGPSQQDIDASKARIAAAQATISQAWIEAPFAGEITLLQPKPGDQVTLNTPAFRLDDLSMFLVDVVVSEVDINQIKPEQAVTLSFDAIRGKDYQGKVVEVDQVGSSNQGVVDFLVTVEIIDPDEQIKPGMTAAVNIVVNQLLDVLRVPNRAVRFKDGRQVVYVLKDGEVVPVNIELGASSEAFSQVLSGELNTGDLIVLNPSTEFNQNGPPPFVQNNR